MIISGNKTTKLKADLLSAAFIKTEFIAIVLVMAITIFTSQPVASRPQPVIQLPVFLPISAFNILTPHVYA